MERRPGPGLWDFAGLGVASAFCIGAGVGGGYWIEVSTTAGTGVVFAGLGIGLLAAFALNYFTIKRFF